MLLDMDVGRGRGRDVDLFNYYRINRGTGAVKIHKKYLKYIIGLLTGTFVHT